MRWNSYRFSCLWKLVSLECFKYRGFISEENSRGFVILKPLPEATYSTAWTVSLCINAYSFCGNGALIMDKSSFKGKDNNITSVRQKRMSNIHASHQTWLTLSLQPLSTCLSALMCISHPLGGRIVPKKTLQHAYDFRGLLGGSSVREIPCGGAPRTINSFDVLNLNLCNSMFACVMMMRIDSSPLSTTTTTISCRRP